jgi:hypothetical protein
MIKCGADTPVRAKVSIVHTFRYKQKPRPAAFRIDDYEPNRSDRKDYSL